MHRTWGVVGVLWALVACGAPSPSQPEYLEIAGRGLGTSWAVKVLAIEGVSKGDIEEAVVGALSRVDEGMSTWRDDSELSQIRRGRGPVAVSKDTADVVVAALAIAEATGGAFDPTVQPLVELWGFHGTPRQTLPTEEEIETARAQVGWERVRVTSRPDDALVDAGGAALDLSAIAKGHAVDRVSESLSGLGLNDHMVEVGGEVRVAGRSPRGGAWALGVDRPDPTSPPGTLFAIVELDDGSLATSGNYRSAYRIGDREVGHTLDPRTGQPVRNGVASASVVAPDCQTADGWATALMVLPADAGMALVESLPDVDAALLVPVEDGFEVRQTTGLQGRWTTR